MPFIPKYDIVPHGVKKNVHNKTVVVFKIIVGFEYERSDAPNDKVFDLKKDSKLRESVDQPWYWQWDNGTKVLKFGRKERPDGDQGSNYTPLEFKPLTGTDTSIKTMRYGIKVRKKNNQSEDMLSFLEDEQNSFNWPTDTPDFVPNSTVQFEEPKEEDQKGGYKERYQAVLDQANQYAGETDNFKKKGVKNIDTDSYDFRAIYANLIDEPELAENEYGLIREFFIDFETFFEKDQPDLNEIEYKILIHEQDTDAQGDFSLIRNENDKFYNGNKKLFFTPDQFENVRAEVTDPLQSYLENSPGEKEKKVPDGIYVITKYKTKEGGGGFEDPFDNEDLKGFNVVAEFLKDDKNVDATWSLSTHTKAFEVLNARRSTFFKVPKTSGVLSPQAEVVIKDGVKDVAIRNNLLFAWRGDNLIVNRRVPDQFEGNGPDKDAIQVGDRDYSEEDEFVRKNLFDRREQLIEKTQQHLLDGYTYRFYLRTVSTSGHYLPLADELSKEERGYTLTFEDFKGKTPFTQKKFDIKDGSILPVGKFRIVGKKNYRNAQSDYVDQFQHMVLDKVKKESKESRFVYPPAIKFESFRFLKHLTKERLKRKNERIENVSIGNFVSRSIRIEDKIQRTIPRHDPRVRRINYIADPRAIYLWFVPADYFTSKTFSPTTIEAYSFTEHYPFFKETKSIEVKAEYDSSKGNTIKVSNMEGVFKPLKTKIDENAEDAENPKYVKIENGIYSFHVYSTDVKDAELSKLKHYGYEPLKISILDRPVAPQEDILRPEDCETIVANRIQSEKNENFWFLKLPTNNNSSTWKSIKYLESTSSLKLHDDDLEGELEKFKENNKDSVKELLLDEYPYKMFLQTEGSTDKETTLKTSVFPEQLLFDIKITEALMGDCERLFSLPLSDNIRLFCEINKATGINIKLEDEVIIKSESGTALMDVAFNLSFNLNTNQYEIKYKDLIYSLKELINQDISVYDIEMHPRALEYLNLDEGCQLDFNRSKNFVFIDDVGHAHYRQKKIRLFSSSVFQAYFPKESTEFPIGRLASKEFDISIPNNVRPKQPVLETEILFLHTLDDDWKDDKSKNIKKHTFESLLRITLKQDFMEEGPNKLGLILSRSQGSKESFDEKTIELGEDITKLTNSSWAGYDLYEVLNDDQKIEAVNKYYKNSDIRYYKFEGDDAVYKVLECQPYYNAALKKWQVILSFKFQESETVFLKLMAVTLSKGVGYDFCQKGGNSESNPFIDKTLTCISKPSIPVHLPIYNKKILKVERRRKEGKRSFEITNDSISSYKEKVFFVMLLKTKLDKSPLNIWNKEDDKTTADFAEFYSFNIGKEQKGTALMFKGKQTVNIERVKCESILILEFEVHENADAIFKGDEPKEEFVDFNPFFDRRGIRLINASEFAY